MSITSPTVGVPEGMVATRRLRRSSGLRGDPSPLHQRRSKRVLDFVGALTMLLLLLPVLVVTAVAVVMSDRGPVLFRQRRMGAGGRQFTILKFRSMRPDAESVLLASPEMYERYLRNGHKLPADEDRRITALGRWLRATSLDELPQLWNVLRGDMSLVGPRPVLPDELEDCYGELRCYYLASRPGVTGVWQVSGRAEVGFPQRALLDQSYATDWTLGRDLRILLRTPLAVFRRRGAY